MLSWLLYAVVGRILIFVWQKFPLQKIKPLQKIELIMEIHSCDLCSGVWIYSIVAWLIGIPPVIGFVLGAITSTVVWIFVRGLKTLYEPTLIIK